MIERIKKRSSFLYVKDTGVKVFTNTCLVTAAPSQNQKTLVGFTATKRIGNAVYRNRAKRRLRHLADTLIPTNLEFPIMFVFIAKEPTVTAPSDKLKSDVLFGINKCIRLLSKDNLK